MKRRFLFLLGVAAAGLVAVAEGCTADDCESNPKLACGPYAPQPGDGGTGGTVSAGCVPASLPGGTPLPDSCVGVFVSGTLGNDTTGTGSRTAPYATLGKALEGAPLVVYACAAPTGDTATVTLPANTSLFGGLDCADWHYTGDKTALAPGATTALVLAPGAGARVEDFHVESATATVPGASSIAVLANGATAALARVELVAGDGADGEAGNSPAASSALDGTNGLNGNPALGAANSCGATPNLGGDGGPKTCGGADVSGGKGGLAINDPGSIGQEGLQPTAATTGDGGPGQQIANPGSHSCQQGQQGGDGTPGSDPTAVTGPGTLAATGYTGVPGSSGGPDTPGQGGGGGGASACTSGVTGPSGGGGGSGGCGGVGATGGTAAGASIALLAFGGELTVSDATLTTGAGGAGGPGGNGQPGGFGGFIPGNAGGAGACGGGAGGNGGPGGSGGGGLGGPSLGVASASAASVILTNPTYAVGAAGAGGLGGDGKGSLDGALGSRCASLDFDSGTCTAP
ncbi:MAG: PGRS family protein [Polyangiaceae bacterium]|nr:PGRS family protein [Polyangiaceae bacterium]